MQNKLCWLQALVLLFFCICAATVHAVQTPVRALTLTWLEDPKTTQTISWQTDADGRSWYVQYREADVPESARASVPVRADTVSFPTDTRVNAVHSATLRGLRPGTRYAYRIGDGEAWQSGGVFQTAPAAAAPFKFLLCSDSQSYDYNVWKQTFEAACSANRDARFYVNLGDLIDNGQSQAEWDGYFSAVAAHAGSLPLVPVVGNHETYTPARAFSLPLYFTQQLRVPQNGPDGLKGQVYSFDYGDAHFVVLDTQFGEERAFLPDALERQKAWLAADLAATDKPWKLVFLHRPPYHSRRSEARPDVSAQFVPIFDAYQVDAVFSGHDHVCARTPKLSGGAPAAHGTVYAAIGRGGTKTYDTVERKSWHAQFYNPLDQPVYSVVQVTDTQLAVQVFKQDGQLLDTWSLTKL